MQNYKGFTLIELMVTISVAGIIMAIAVPEMKTMRSNSVMSSVANDLASDLKKARNEAILARRNQTLAAIDATVSTNIWGNKGWQLSQVVNSVTKVAFQNKTVPKGVVVNTTSSSFIFVAATGMVQTTDGNPANVTFKVCDSQSSTENGYDVLINQFGRVYVKRHANLTVCNA